MTIEVEMHSEGEHDFWEKKAQRNRTMIEKGEVGSLFSHLPEAWWEEARKDKSWMKDAAEQAAEQDIDFGDDEFGMQALIDGR